MECEAKASALDRQSSPAEVVAWAKERNLPAYLVGRWVWVAFTEAPPIAVREELRANGFRWVARRGAWAHPCGTFSRPARSGNPFATYGAVPVAELGDTAAVGA